MTKKTNNVDTINEDFNGLECGQAFIEGDNRIILEMRTYQGPKTFDSTTKNYHIMMADECARISLAEAYKEKRTDMINTLDAGKCKIPTELMLLPKKKSGFVVPTLNKNEIQLHAGRGSSGGKPPFCGLYKYLAFYCNNKWFRINFMRSYVDKNKVNCIFNSLQYEMDCGEKGDGVNLNNGDFDLCYPNSSANGEEGKNGFGNVVFNPSVSYYADSETILKDFFDFVVKHKD